MPDLHVLAQAWEWGQKRHKELRSLSCLEAKLASLVQHRSHHKSSQVNQDVSITLSV